MSADRKSFAALADAESERPGSPDEYVGTRSAGRTLWAGGTGFASLDEARRTITRWRLWYDQDRPHQALNYQTPDETYTTLTKSAA